MSASDPVPSSALPYRPALNYVRAVAVWLVILGHWTLAPIPIDEMGRLTFFVLSGYLISGIIWKYKIYVRPARLQLRRLGVFYARRALRILPPYYVALVLGALLPLATLHDYPGWFVLPAGNLLFYRLQRWGEGMGHYWTLAVDEQFYLLWPLVLTLVPRRLGLLLALAAAGVLFRLAWSVWVRPGFVLVLLPASLDLFAMGAMLRHTEHWPLVQRLARLRWVLLAWASWAGAWLTMNLLFDGTALWLPLYPFWGAGAACVTLAWVQHRPAGTSGPGWLVAAAEWVGQRSYGCYLYHLMLPVLYQRIVYYLLPATTPNFAAQRQFWVSPLPTVLLLTPILLVMTAASWKWVESPLERFRARLHYDASMS